MSISNENILWLILSSYMLISIKQIFDKTNNLTLNKILLKKLSYKNIFKTIGKANHILWGHIDYINKIISTNNGNIISMSYDETFKIWDTKNYTCINGK
jgi:WD40 repeat protein